VFIGATALLTLAGFVANDRRDFLHALTYTMNYEGSSDHFSLRHLWSLSVEEQFYFVWPMTLAVLGAARGSLVLAAVLAFVPVLRIGLYQLVPGYETYIMTGFESVCDALAAGALLAIVLPKIRDREWFRRLIASPAFPILFVVVFLANRQTDHPHLFWFAAIPLMNGCIALIVARYVEYPGLPFGRLLNTRLLASIGLISYSIYLWQELFLVQWRTPTSFLQEFPFNVVAALVCGIASYKLVEQPFLRLKKRFEPARAPVRGPAVRLPHAVDLDPIVTTESPTPA
jgi:peptidoglycan/LPS O-acetylase OafA/YrhL